MLDQTVQALCNTYVETVKRDTKGAMRSILINILLIAVTTALLVHFALLWAYSEVLIQEPNKIILAIETVAFFGILGFSIYGFTQKMRGRE